MVDDSFFQPAKGETAATMKTVFGRGVTTNFVIDALDVATGHDLSLQGALQAG